MSDYIPQEVWIDILTRLPIETLIRCISISKSWYSLITTPTFISQHLNRTTAANNDLLLVRNYSDNSKKEHYSLHFDNHTFDAYKTLDFPFMTPNHYFRVIGCSNGLLCLSDDQFYYNHTMILWNPSMRKYVNLPWPRITFNSHALFMQSIGFGFNVANNDYKVVKVVHLQETCGYKAPPKVEIYELTTGSWRSVNPMGFPYVVGERSS
ncbi:hypothetical protein HYC85_026776 [Camellia sinensis]|uniref:F-box domain-containing protein n=1 Tax=Camellia sinensis TaxID=4442 RepID=A0A7J7G502_CAMSI|nr:hypothetical protein HYC85_026776 [Camellia sinensis]